MQTFAGTVSAAHASTSGQAEATAKTSRSIAKSAIKIATGNRSSANRNRVARDAGLIGGL